MPSAAKMIILGHVGNTKIIKSNYMKFSIATKNRDGTTSWFDILTSDVYAIKNIGKGDFVFVEGFVEISEYNRRKTITVFAEKVYLLKKKESSDETKIELVIENNSSEDNPPF